MKAEFREVFIRFAAFAWLGTAPGSVAAQSDPLQSGFSQLPSDPHLSRWSRSGAKRFFDYFCVLSTLPFLVPVLLVLGLAVRVTSSGPILFRQRRISRNGRAFVILKFRTMVHTSGKAHPPVSTNRNQPFTPIGAFLRRWKLDELPQLMNVLAGHMSLVGPRPKLPEHALSSFPCRAGITGAATAVFAREETILGRVPNRDLESFYYSAVLPAKHELDAKYMARATFLSDLQLIVDSVLRRWDTTAMEGLLTTWTSEQDDSNVPSAVAEADAIPTHIPTVPTRDRLAANGELLIQSEGISWQ